MSESFDKSLLDGANSQASVKLNPLDYPSVVCDNCGCETFVPGYVFKKIPGMLIGRGSEEQLVPIDVFVCSKCGDLMPEYKEKKEEKEEKKSSLIL